MFEDFFNRPPVHPLPSDPPSHTKSQKAETYFLVPWILDIPECSLVLSSSVSCWAVAASIDATSAALASRSLDSAVGKGAGRVDIKVTGDSSLQNNRLGQKANPDKTYNNIKDK